MRDSTRWASANNASRTSAGTHEYTPCAMTKSYGPSSTARRSTARNSTFESPSARAEACAVAIAPAAMSQPTSVAPGRLAAIGSRLEPSLQPSSSTRAVATGGGVAPNIVTTAAT